MSSSKTICPLKVKKLMVSSTIKPVTQAALELVKNASTNPILLLTKVPPSSTGRVI